jgi:DNA-binding NarL/FixJ family response regulator
MYWNNGLQDGHFVDFMHSFMIYSKRVIVMMEYTMIALVIISLFLLVASFFGKDRLKSIEEQIDHLTLSLAQETYQLKKRLKVLEEELLIDEGQPLTAAKRNDDRLSSARDRVWLLYKQGLSYEQIARETALTAEEVRMMLRGLIR